MNDKGNSEKFSSCKIRSTMNPMPNAKSRILVVDDAQDIQMMLTFMLETADCEVLTADDGLTALEMVRRDAPDLILLDVMMSGMDGYEVCERLKADEASRSIPVIFITALSDNEAQTRGFDLGAADFITKPISMNVLLARVKTHLALYAQRRSLEGMFRDVIEFAPDAFILTDPSGQIVQLNARAEELFGYRRDELVGQPVELLIPPRLRAVHEEHRSDYTRNAGRMVKMGAALSCLRKDGSEFPADINLSPLQTNRGNLLMAVVRDVSDRQRAEQALMASGQRLRELTVRTEAARENERKHIAREVHDELGQVLTALRMDLSFLGMQSSADHPGLKEKTETMKALVDRAILGVRNVASSLRPAALDMGLASAIEWICGEFASRTGMACEFHVDQDVVEMDEARAVVLFRIVQESLTNIARYAQASRVDISMHQQDECLKLEVSDDGLGFDLSEARRKKSFGLLGMQERAIALGGLVEVNSAPGQGTRISVSIPLQFDATEKDNP